MDDSGTELRLRVEYPGAADFLHDYFENIRPGKTFILTPRDLEVGAALLVEFSFPGLLESIVLRGKVTRRREGSLSGVEVAFGDVDQAEWQRLDRLIKGIEESDPLVVARTVRLLIVEDNPHIVELLEDGMGYLSAREYNGRVRFEVLHVHDGVEALELLAREFVDVIITDIYMPVMDGVALVKSLRSDPKLAEIPIMVVSGGPDRVQSLLDASGSMIFLEKPLRLNEVQKGLRQLVRI